jgi:RNA ligase (TIGR02306 family)
MERALATIDVIADLKPIENADFLELAIVRGWQCVVKKGDFRVGDYCVYFEIDSLLPDIEQFKFLAKGSGLKICAIDGEERKGYRLKTVKLRQQISQGLAMPIDVFPEIRAIAYSPYEPFGLVSFLAGRDVTALLGVYKYENPIGSELAAFAKGPFPGFVPKTDEERVQNMRARLGYQVGVACQITEKLDGMSATFFRFNGEFGVCSRNLELKDGDNVFWNMARKYNLDKMADGYAIQGEIIGPGIQGNPLMRSKPELYVFSLYDINAGEYLDVHRQSKPSAKLIDVLGSDSVPLVPLVDYGVIHTDVAKWIADAEGKSALSSAQREGIVVRSASNGKTMETSRLSFKAISNAYLLKHDA